MRAHLPRSEQFPDDSFKILPCGGTPRGRAIDDRDGPRHGPALGRSAKRPCFRKIGLGLLAAVGIGAGLFVGSAAATTFPIPGDQPVVTVDIPDSWRPTPVRDGVEGVALQGAVHLTVNFVSAPDLNVASAAAIKKLAGRDVVVAPATKRTAPRRFSGFDAFKIDFSGVDPNGESSITLILIATPTKSGFVSISFWGDDDAQESVSNEIQSIADSVEIAK